MQGKMEEAEDSGSCDSFLDGESQAGNKQQQRLQLDPTVGA